MEEILMDFLQKYVILIGGLIILLVGLYFLKRDYNEFVQSKQKDKKAKFQYTVVNTGFIIFGGIIALIGLFIVLK